MGLPQSYKLLLIRHPAKILFCCSCSILLLLILTVILKPLPSFKDPLFGFEARKTLIASRLNAWKLLIDETSASSNNLSLVPYSNKFDGNHHSSSQSSTTSFIPSKPSDNELDSQDYPTIEPPLIEMSTQLLNNNNSNTLNKQQFDLATGNNISNFDMDEDEDEYYKSINSTVEVLPSLMHYSLGSSKAFCGKLYEGYAQVVVSPSTRYSSSGLFNINSILAICQLDRRLRLEHSVEDSHIFQKQCERFQINRENNSDSEYYQKPSACCNSWSLPNYVACLNNKTTCMNIDISDLKNTEHLINQCAPYYYAAPYEECFTTTTISEFLPLKELNKDSSTINPRVSSNVNSISVNQPNSYNRLFRSYCGSIPEKCLRCDGWIYTVMNYLVNENFILNRLSLNENITVRAYTSTPQSKQKDVQHSYDKKRNHNNLGKETNFLRLTYTNIFLPIAKGSQLMKYYYSITKNNLKTPYAQVKAMDLGLKNSLFEHLISDDTRLFIIALIVVLFVISIYTWSIFVSLIILSITFLSICLSYTIYELILNIPTFPFMNLLAVVISFAIGADNILLFYKYSSIEIDNNDNNNNVNNNNDLKGENNGVITEQQNEAKKDNQQTNQYQSNNNINELQQVELQTIDEHLRLDKMLKRAILSSAAATVVSSISILMGIISKVIAIRCFAIFAHLTILTNYILILILFPPSLILDIRFSFLMKKFLSNKGSQLDKFFNTADKFKQKLINVEQILHNRLIHNLITKYKFYFIITFLTILTCSSILYFHNSSLQPSEDGELQLLSTKHAFEQYDKKLKKQFTFERSKMGELINSNNQQSYDLPDTLPIRVIFGIKPTDNGNYYDTQDRGTLEFDRKFDLADSDSQLWLLKFCKELRSQRFIHHSSGPDLSSCFIDTFKSWMESRNCRDPIQTDIDRSPCCQAYEFPYSRYTFDKCIGEAVSIMRKTPQFYPNVNGGIRFYKNSTKVAAIIIEYQSKWLYSESFKKMEKFFTDIDNWISWQINDKAPEGLKSGWFISSNLELLALQKELDSCTVTLILLSLIFFMIALIKITNDIILVMAGMLTIGTIILSTVASLVLLKWSLGVTESIFISSILALSVNFTLHYLISFKTGRDKSSMLTNGLIFRALNQVGGPITLATITTSLAGLILIWSDILAYQELGLFLVLIASISWLTSTFFLLPLLAITNSIIERIKIWRQLIVSRAVKIWIERY